MDHQCPFPENCRGVLSERFLEALGLYFDNVEGRNYTGTWRQFGVILLNLQKNELNDLERRSKSDPKNSPTWSVFQKYLQSRSDEVVDIRALWDVLHHEMDRPDAASRLVDFYNSNTLFHPQPGQSRTLHVLAVPQQSQSFPKQPPHESGVEGVTGHRDNALLPRGGCRLSPCTMQHLQEAYNHAEDSRFGLCSWNCVCGGPGCDTFEGLRSSPVPIPQSRHDMPLRESHERDARQAVNGTRIRHVEAKNKYPVQDNSASSSETLVPQQSHPTGHVIFSASIQSQATGYACQPSSAAVSGNESRQVPRNDLSNLNLQNVPMATPTTAHDQPFSSTPCMNESHQVPRNGLNNMHLHHDPLATPTTARDQPSSTTPYRNGSYQVPRNNAYGLHPHDHPPATATTTAHGQHSSAILQRNNPHSVPANSLLLPRDHSPTKVNNKTHGQPSVTTPYVNESQQVPRNHPYGLNPQDHPTTVNNTTLGQPSVTTSYVNESHQVPRNHPYGLNPQDHPTTVNNTTLGQLSLTTSYVNESHQVPRNHPYGLNPQDHPTTVNNTTLGQLSLTTPYVNESHQVPRNDSYGLHPQDCPPVTVSNTTHGQLSSTTPYVNESHQAQRNDSYSLHQQDPLPAIVITKTNSQHYASTLQGSKPHSGQENNSLLTQDCQTSPAVTGHRDLSLERNETRQVHQTSGSTPSTLLVQSDCSLQRNGRSIPGLPNSYHQPHLSSPPGGFSNVNSPAQRSPAMSQTHGTMDANWESNQLVSRGPKLQCSPSVSPLARGGALSSLPSFAPVELIREVPGASDVSPSSSLVRHASHCLDVPHNVGGRISWNHQKPCSKWKRQDSQGWSDVTSETTDGESQETVVEANAELSWECEPLENCMEIHPGSYQVRDNPGRPQIARGCSVGISFDDQDLHLAERVLLTLQDNGCQTVLIKRSNMRGINEMDAVIVIYTRHYQKNVLDKKFFLVVPCTRFVYDRLSKECRSHGQPNRRCVFYPGMAEVAKSMHLPSMFLHYPSQPGASAVYRCLYDIMPPRGEVS